MRLRPGRDAASSRRSATTRSRSRSATSCYLDRERCILCDRCTRFAKEVAGDPLIHFMDRGNQHRGQHLPRRAVRLVLQRQHRADLPGRRAHREAVPLQGPPVGPRRRSSRPARPARSAAASRSQSSPQPGAALPGRRHRPGQLGLAVRQGPLRLRGRRQPTTASASRCVPHSGDELGRPPLGRGARPRPPTPIRGRATPADRSPCSAAPASPTRRPTPGPSWPRASSAPTTSTPSSATACRPRSCSACRGPPSTRSAPRAAPSSASGPT